MRKTADPEKTKNNPASLSKTSYLFQGEVQFLTGGDSPRADFRLNRCNSGTDGIVRMEETDCAGTRMRRSLTVTINAREPVRHGHFFF